MRRRIRSKSLFFIIASSLLFGCASSNTAFNKRGVNFDDFLGEKIVIEKEYSAQIKNLNLRVYLPKQYELLPKADSKVELFTKEEFVQSFGITNSISTFEVNETIRADSLFFKLSLLLMCARVCDVVCICHNTFSDA